MTPWPSPTPAACQRMVTRKRWLFTHRVLALATHGPGSTRVAAATSAEYGEKVPPVPVARTRKMERVPGSSPGTGALVVLGPTVATTS